MLNHFISRLIWITPLLFIAGCSFIPADKLTSDEARHVVISIDTPKENCSYVGNIFGSQGNWFTGFFTSNLQLSLGAINNLRNQAADNGANYVYFGQLYASDVSILRGAFSLNLMTTPLKTITGTFNATYYGEAYYCPTLRKITVRTPPDA